MKAILGLFLLCLACTLPARAATLPASKSQQLTSLDEVPEGLAKSDWSSIRAAYEAGRHQFFKQEDGSHVARNPGMGWQMKFDEHGFTAQPEDGAWTWGLEVASSGTRSSGDVRLRVPLEATANRLSRQLTPAITEWFVNDSRGLEQGWTLTAPAEIRLRVRGNLKPSVSPQSISFGGQLTYSGLKAWDATGKTVPTHFESTAEGFTVRFDDADAQYPITIDPIAQQAFLKAGNNAPPSDDGFGSAVSISGDTVIVGAPREDSGSTGVDSVPDESAPNSGAAYVFVRTGTTWSQQAYVKASQVSANDSFGKSVAVSGNTVVVGAHIEASSTTGINSTPDENAPAAGAAYVFVRNGTNWSQQAYLKASNTGVGDYFGISVAVSGDTVVVGASEEDSSTVGINSTPNEGATDAGSAYVFVRSGTNWSQQAYLKPAAVGTTQINDSFGETVAVAGDTVVVGAWGEDSNTTGVNSTPNESAQGAGAAYVFLRSGTAWSQQAYLKASNPDASDLFGQSVAISGETVVVGAPQEKSTSTGVNSIPNNSAVETAGAAYVFVRSGTTWSQQAYLKASYTGYNGWGTGLFGSTVSIAGDIMVAGAPYEDGGTSGINSTPTYNGGNGNNSGAAFIFVRSGTTWSEQAYLKSGNNSPLDEFGTAVGVSGNTVLVGSPHEDSGTTGVNSVPDTNGTDSGAGYVFTLSGSTWSQEAFVKSSNTQVGTGVGDFFGKAVAISGDTVVIGAESEDSGTNGINSMSDESRSDSGAAYVFVRAGGAWIQQAYLKASNASWSHWFGRSVGVSGDTIVVGSPRENSNSTGVNSVPNNSISYYGAAYVFVRSGSTWSQQAYLKPMQINAGDNFGESVAVNGDTVVVGAPDEDSSIGGVNFTPNESASSAGAAYVFVRSGTTWSQQAYLKAVQVSAGDLFGTSVAVSGTSVIVGARSEDSSTSGINSSPNETASAAGAAYVFVRNGTAWSQQAYLKASNTGTGDRFGSAVTISSNTAIVGAAGEDSGTTGVNSVPDEGGADSGAAYVFQRTGSSWIQQAYLKAGNSVVTDEFGCSVAVSGDSVVVGARYEDSSTTGINSTPNDAGNGFDAGAAYLFSRTGSTWSQQAYLKASNAGTDDEFGYSVAIDGGTLVVGAYREASSTTGANGTPDDYSQGAGAAYMFSGFGPDTNPPASGTMSLSPSSTFDPLAALTVSFAGWTDDSLPLSYEVYIDDIIIGVKGSSASRNVTGPTTPGVHTLKGRIYDALNNMTEVTQSFTVRTSTQSFTHVLTNAGLAGGDAALDATPHNDGVENLLKYAFNMNLSGPDAATMPPGGSSGLPGIATQPNGASSIFRYEFVRRRNSGLIYTPQKSPDISNPALWTNLTDVPTVIPIDANWERLIYEEPYNATTMPKCFGRVQVTLP